MARNKTLYISDLDGTLLDNDRKLSAYTLETLNSLIEKGLWFTAASARTGSTALKILEGLNINVPVVLMNGVVIYDTGSSGYINIEDIPAETAVRVTDILRDYGVTGFMYAINDNVPVTFYESLESKPLKDFYDERVTRYGKYFEKLESLKEGVAGNRIVYFTLIDRYEPLKRMLEDFGSIEGLETTLYRDVYTEDGWFLELYSANASKHNAVRYIRERFGFDRVIGFGDNLNDLPLFRACDECYAVSNAVDELKEIATGIIGENIKDGVPRFIYERMNKKP